jgi:hypothetical protein
MPGAWGHIPPGHCTLTVALSLLIHPVPVQNQKLYKTVKLESFAVVCYVPEHRVGGQIMGDFLEVGG